MVYKNILLMNLRKIGDTVMATASAYLLKKSYPQAKITMLVKPSNEIIVRNNPVIDDVKLYDYSHKEKYKGLWALAKDLKAEKYDLAVVVDGKLRSAMIAYLAGIPEIVGHEKITMRNIYLKLFYTKIFVMEYAGNTRTPVQRYEDFINKFTGKNIKPKMCLPDCDNDGKLEIDNYLKDIKGEKMGVCIRSGVPFKDYAQDDFVEVLNQLADEWSFYLVGAPGDESYAEDFIKKLDRKVIIKNLVGKTSLLQLYYLLSKMDYNLSVDTGTAHMAAATGKPGLTIFAGTSHYQWGPYGEKMEHIYPLDLACYPCNDQVRKVCKSYKCLKDITPKQIVDKIEAFNLKGEEVK